MHGLSQNMAFAFFDDLWFVCINGLFTKQISTIVGQKIITKQWYCIGKKGCCLTASLFKEQ
jgi:hypothetical protein